MPNARWGWPLALAVLTIGDGSWVRAQSPAAADPLVASLADKVDRFMGDISTGNAEPAFYDLLAASPLLKQKEQIAALVAKTQDLKTAYGAFRGFEQVAARRVGKDVVLFQYLYKCDTFPVLWNVTWYRDVSRPETTAEPGVWRVVTLRFDTNLEALLK